MLLGSDKEKDVLVTTCWHGGLGTPLIFLNSVRGCLCGLGGGFTSCALFRLSSKHTGSWLLEIKSSLLSPCQTPVVIMLMPNALRCLPSGKENDRTSFQLSNVGSLKPLVYVQL